MNNEIKAVKFRNYTDTPFTWKFDGIPYTFPAGQETYLENFKAEHFAKHLIDRELTKNGIDTGMKHEREPLLAKCLPAEGVITPAEALDINEKAKRGRPRKNAEKEFADLEDN